MSDPIHSDGKSARCPSEWDGVQCCKVTNHEGKHLYLAPGVHPSVFGVPQCCIDSENTQRITALEAALKQAVPLLERAAAAAVAKARRLHERREAVAEAEALLLVLKFRDAIEAAKKVLS